MAVNQHKSVSFAAIFNVMGINSFPYLPSIYFEKEHPNTINTFFCHRT